MNDIAHADEAIRWAKWVAPYYDHLGSLSKTHLVSGDGKTTLCGRQVPSEADAYEIEGDSIWTADCKRCLAKRNGAA